MTVINISCLGNVNIISVWRRSSLWMSERTWKTVTQPVQHSSISKNHYRDPSQKSLRDTELSW